MLARGLISHAVRTVQFFPKTQTPLLLSLKPVFGRVGLVWQRTLRAVVCSVLFFQASFNVFKGPETVGSL